MIRLMKKGIAYKSALLLKYDKRSRPGEKEKREVTGGWVLGQADRADIQSMMRC